MGRIKLAAVQKKASGSVDIDVIIVGEREVITVCVEDQSIASSLSKCTPAAV